MAGVQSEAVVDGDWKAGAGDVECGGGDVVETDDQRFGEDQLQRE